MILKNGEYVGIVEKIGVNGEGIIKNDGIVIFIPNVLPEEKIKYKVLKVAKNYAYGKVVEILVPADDRVRPICPVADRCGGCQLQHLSYPMQLKFKTTLVADCLTKIGNLNVSVKPTIKNDNEFYYRNKLQLPIASKNGETFIGFYAENSHRIIPINKCYIHPDWSEKIISALKEYISKCHILGYDEELKIGLLRHVVVRETGSGFIITLVATSENLPKIEYFIELLKKSFVHFSLYLNVNDKDTNVIFGDRFILKYGKPFYQTEVCGIVCEIGVKSFMQVNNYIASKIYQNVVKLIDCDEDTYVIDAYSGAGLMTAMLAKKAKMAYGIEIIDEAVEVANNLAKLNGLSDKMVSICGDCSVELPPLVEELSSKGKVSVVLDPPRKGCDRKVIEAIKKCKIDKIVYVSCNPATLARDLGLLVGSLKYDGNEIKKVTEYTPEYNIDLVRPYDMFSQTKHVESVVCLTRNWI